MLRRRWWFAVLPLLAVHPVMAANYAVGTCKPKLTSFASITAAVGTVPSGSTIFVCPGTYPGQVVITKRLNLQGIAIANQGQAVIAVPAVGFAPNVTSVNGVSVAAQVLVQTRGPVNITNITVDGTGGTLAAPDWVAGIFYSTGSSGEVSRVQASNQLNLVSGVGIWIENDGSSNQNVTVEDSSVHDNDLAGIFVLGLGRTLYATIQGNVVSTNAGLFGIALANVAGEVSGNDVSNSMFGIVDAGTKAEVESNTVNNTNEAIVLEGGGPVTGNRVSNSDVGVMLNSSGTVQSNRITKTTFAAVEFNCNTANVSHNTINDAVLGLDNVPGGDNGSNSFSNTATIGTDGCPPPAAALSAVQGASATTGGSIWQWRSPASPLGRVK